MRSSKGHKRTSQRSVPFFISRSREMELPDYYVYMFQEDLNLGILPLRGWRAESGFKVIITPMAREVAELIAAALPSEYGPRYDIEGAVSHFIEEAAQLLVWYGRAFYEIVFEYEEGEKPVGFRITHIQDNCIHDAAAFCWQFLPAARSGSFDFSDATEKAAPNLFHRFVWISKSRMLTIKMPSELGGRRLMLRTIRTLAQASRSALPELAIAEANESSPKSGYDFTIHRRLTEMIVARATRSFGWPMRGTADETSLEFYRLYRNLLFENAKVIIRDHILDALNNALARVGKVMGFKAEISLLGVRTRKECEDALRDIQSGKLQIGDAWKMLMD